jgi:hypothetical protein
MTLLGLTADGKKIVQLQVTGSASVGSTSFGNVSCTIPLGELSRADAVLGIASITLDKDVYLTHAVATTSTLTVRVYNPGGSGVTVGVTALVTLIGV